MISLAGVSTSRPDPEILLRAARLLDGSGAGEFLPFNWGHSNNVGVGALPPRINVLYWPRGASNPAHGLYLARTSEAAAIRSAVTAASLGPLTLRIDDSRRAVETAVYVHPLVPLAGSGQGDWWLVPVVDQRWFWAKASADIAVTAGTTTWAQLFAAIGTALGVSIAVDAPDAAYLLPPGSFTSYRGSLPELLDRAAAAVGCVVTRQLDGTVRVISAANSLALHAANLALTTRQCGGELALLDSGTPSPDDRPLALPAFVDVVFPSLSAAAPYVSRVAISPAGRGVEVIASTAASSGANAAELDALAAVVARDWRLWRLGRAHLALIGAAPWVSDGHADVEWEQTADEILTRARASTAVPEAPGGGGGGTVRVFYQRSSVGSAGPPVVLSRTVVDSILSILNSTVNVGGSTVTVTDTSWTFGGTTTTTFAGTTTVVFAGTTVNLTDSSTWTLSAGEVWTLTGGATSTLALSFPTISVSSSAVTLDASSSLTVDGVFVLCGLWTTCYNTSLTSITTNQNPLDLSTIYSTVIGVPINGNIAIRSVKRPGGSTDSSRYTLRNTGSGTATLYHLDATATTPRDRVATPTGLDILWPPGTTLELQDYPALGYSVLEGGTALAGQVPPGQSAYIPEVTAPGTPASGYGVAYAKTDGLPYFKNDGGTEYRMVYVDEDAQDAIGFILADTDTIDATYTDATPAISFDVKKQMSITSDSSGLKLVGDSSSPGNLYFYGTNGSGTKAWYAQSTISSGSARSRATVAATGTNQGTAAALTSAAANDVSGADGTKGVILVDSPGDIVIVRNSNTLNALKIYPPSGAQIDSLGTNVADGLTGNTRVYWNVTATLWKSQSLL